MRDYQYDYKGSIANNFFSEIFGVSEDQTAFDHSEDAENGE